MKWTLGRGGGLLLAFRVVLEPGDHPEHPDGGEVDVSISLWELRAHFAKALTSTGGKAVLGGGALTFKRVRE